MLEFTDEIVIYIFEGVFDLFFIFLTTKSRNSFLILKPVRICLYDPGCYTTSQ